MKWRDSEDRYQVVGDWVSTIMSEEKPDSLMSFMNISYEFIYRILEEFDLKRIETNARLIVTALRSTPISELRDLVGNYFDLEEFCKKIILKERHNQASFSIQARALLPKVYAENVNRR